MSNMTEPLSKAWLVALLAASLTACGGGGGGGGDSTPPPSGTQPPPAPAPPPPPPPASSDAPPLSASVTDITSGQRIGAIHWSNGNTGSGGAGSPVDGIECLLNMPDTYHAHSYLGIYLNGELLAVPQSVGIVTRTPDPRCYYAIHTHDLSGQIHVEAAAQGVFTLGQLFNIWGQPLSDTNVAGLTGNPVEVFVVENGVVTEVESNWGDIELTSKKMVHIVVGTHPAELRNITWTGN